MAVTTISRGRLVGMALVGLALIPIAATLLIRLTGWDLGAVSVALMGMLPYVTMFAVVVAGLSPLTRHWGPPAISVVLAAGLIAVLLPRGVGHADDLAGRRLRIMSLNLYYGEADPARVVSLVRSHHVDVLSLEELGNAELRRLNRAGLSSLLPHQDVVHTPYTGGVGLFSTHALTPLHIVGATTYSNRSAQLGGTGSTRVQLVSFHANPPRGSAGRADWKSDMAALPDGRVDDHTCRIIAGDFNATRDHEPFRKVLARGYRDAASVVGGGWRPTWWEGGVILPMTIDHVLVSRPCGVADYHVSDVADTDHNAIFATVIVP